MTPLLPPLNFPSKAQMQTGVVGDPWSARSEGATEPLCANLSRDAGSAPGPPLRCLLEGEFSRQDVEMMELHDDCKGGRAFPRL